MTKQKRVSKVISGIAR